jgi:glycosyltransferase involved in cell wall biosynthesis
MAMIAALILGIDFSLTLHGSDLLVHENHLAAKLSRCKFCVTVSEFNRRYIRSQFPEVPSDKIVAQHTGIECGSRVPIKTHAPENVFSLFTVGRLHPVKDHAFLIRACRELKDRGVPVSCEIAGDGPERQHLQDLIEGLQVKAEVRLLGQVPRESLCQFYDRADLVVLTSRSEGIPLVLMEAMARGRPVLAPAITGIPELVVDGVNGFLYSPGSVDSFVEKVVAIRNDYGTLGPLRKAAQRQVQENFNCEKNVAEFCDMFLDRIGHRQGRKSEDSLLQQIQLSI